MKNLIRLEEVTLFGFSIFLFNQTSFEWWWYLALILVPDLGMLGYVANPKVGAVTYNLTHHKGVAIIILITGYYLANQWLILTGIIMFGHSSLDRIFGYGLKYPDDFKNTHLGRLSEANR